MKSMIQQNMWEVLTEQNWKRTQLQTLWYHPVYSIEARMCIYLIKSTVN